MAGVGQLLELGLRKLIGEALAVLCADEHVAFGGEHIDGLADLSERLGGVVVEDSSGASQVGVERHGRRVVDEVEELVAWAAASDKAEGLGELVGELGADGEIGGGLHETKQGTSVNADAFGEPGSSRAEQHGVMHWIAWDAEHEDIGACAIRVDAGPLDGDLHAHGKADHDGLLVVGDEGTNDLVEVIGMFGDGVPSAGRSQVAVTVASVIPVHDAVIAGELAGDGVHEHRSASDPRGEDDGSSVLSAQDTACETVAAGAGDEDLSGLFEGQVDVPRVHGKHVLFHMAWPWVHVEKQPDIGGSGKKPSRRAKER